MVEADTFSVHRSEWSRWILECEFRSSETAYGKIAIKVGKQEGEIINISPEYEDVKIITSQCEVPLIDVYLAVNKKLGEKWEIKRSRKKLRRVLVYVFFFREKG